jgi:hypothetical protein
MAHVIALWQDQRDPVAHHQVLGVAPGEPQQREENASV